MQSKNFTLPADGIAQFMLAGYGGGDDGARSNNYVTLNDAVSGAELGRAYPSNIRDLSASVNMITPPSAYQGTGSNVYLKVIDGDTLSWGWLAFDNLEIVVPEPAFLGLLSILGLAFLRRK